MKSSMIIVLPPVRMAAQKKQYITHGTIEEQLHIDSVYMKLFHIKGLMKLPRDHP